MATAEAGIKTAPLAVKPAPTAKRGKGQDVRFGDEWISIERAQEVIAERRVYFQRISNSLEERDQPRLQGARCQACALDATLARLDEATADQPLNLEAVISEERRKADAKLVG